MRLSWRIVWVRRFWTFAAGSPWSSARAASCVALMAALSGDLISWETQPSISSRATPSGETCAGGGLVDVVFTAHIGRRSSDDEASSTNFA